MLIQSSIETTEHKVLAPAVHMSAKELDDYIAFFTTQKGLDMISYVYNGSGGIYDNLVESQEYYLCKEETKNITENLEILGKHLSEVTNIIEIGPGSGYPLEHKTLPILKSAKDLKCYHGVDYSKTYLKDALSFLKNNTSGIQIRGEVADLLNGEVKIGKHINGKKAILFLGSTIGNFDLIQRNHVMNQLAKLACTDDVLIITFDINQDLNSLILAYTNLYTRKFLYGIFVYLATFSPDFPKNLDLFELKASWDTQKVEMYFKVKEDLSFTLPGYGEIRLHKNQELRGVASYKFTIDSISNLLLAKGFNIVEILNTSNRLATVICKKI